MLLLFRSIAVLLALSCAVAAYGEPTPAPAPDALPADLQAEINKLVDARWTHEVTLRGSTGYRDNILLSAFTPTGRSFGRAEIEMMALNVPQGAWDWRAFLNGDVLRYLSPLPEAKGEQEWFLHGEAGWSPFTWFRAGLSAQGYYQDMVLDLSESEADRVIAPLRVRGGIGNITTRINLPWKLKLEPSAQLHRSDYLNYPGDYTESKLGSRVSWDPCPHFGISAAGFERRRHFSERTEFTAGGRELPDTRLRFTQKEADVQAQCSWNLAGSWNADVSVGELRNRDGASGYFDYDQKHGKAELAWNPGHWTFTVTQDLQRQNYLVQRVGAGINPPPRTARTRETELRTEYRVSSAWSVFAEVHRERSQSNESEFNYTARSYLAGIERTF